VDNAAVRWGTAAERAIIELAAPKITGLSDLIQEREAFFSHPDYDFITCHLDGIYQWPRDKMIHEGKTTSAYSYRDKWGEAGTAKVPREYQVQVQHQMMCSGIQAAIVSVLIWPGRADDFEAVGAECCEETVMRWAPVLAEMGYFQQYKIEADAALQSMMIEHYREFWEKNVLTETMPAPKTYDDIRLLCPEPKGTIVADEGELMLSAEYAAITDEMSLANKRKAQIKTQLLASMSRRAEAPIDDESVEKWILRDNAGKKLNTYDGKVFR
jgi:predicted phage-related endonuclease